MRRFRGLVAVLIAVALPCASSAQTTPGSQAAVIPGPSVLEFEEFLGRVGEVNLEAAATRASLPIAVAQIAVARIFPNPTLTVGLGQVDISGQGAPTASFVGFTVPVELGGKRRRRVAAAEAGRDVVSAELEAHLLALRADAAVAYVDALEAKLALERQQRTLASLERLVEVNRHRFEHGDIGETVFLQSQVEYESFRARLYSVEGQLRGAETVLSLYASAAADSPEPISVHGDLLLPVRQFDEDELVQRALAMRPDLVARMRSLERARAMLGLARVNRIIDAQLNVGWTHNGSTSVPQFRQHANDTLGATVTVPLPFSNRHRGPVLAAQGMVQQEGLLLHATELRVRTEVRRALAEYRAAADRLEIYGTGLLSRADQVLERVMYEYQHGGTTLIEVLLAQRTANQVHLDYYEALAAHARALIRLETAVGIWDVRFE
ncbi:MAG: TolC family protein [Polyangiales bacterium]